MVKIRRAKKEDYVQLMSLYNGFVGEERYSNYNHDSFNQVLDSPSSVILVAEEQQTLVGFITFSFRRVVRYPKPIVEIDELYVSPKYRRKRVGRKLLEKSLEDSKKAGCYRMFIETHHKLKEAHRFYESMGFTNYGYHYIKDL